MRRCTSLYSGQLFGTVIRTRSAYGRMTANSTIYDELKSTSAFSWKGYIHSTSARLTLGQFAMDSLAV